MEKEDVMALISIGFCQPKFYKRSTWNKAKKIMEFLCENTDEVIRHDFGPGKGKYLSTGDVKTEEWAILYLKSKGTFRENVHRLERLSNKYGIKINNRNSLPLIIK